MDNSHWYFIVDCFVEAPGREKNCIESARKFFEVYETRMKKIEQEKECLSSRIIELEERISNLEK